MIARHIETLMRENGEGAQRYVRVTGVRNQQFTEFEFSIGDPTLFVELALPFKEFRDFCARNFVQHLTVEQCAEVDFDQLKWRHGDPDFDN